MKEKTLKTKIRDLPTAGNASGFVRQLAGVSGQKYRDAHRCLANAKEGDVVDVQTASAHTAEQAAVVADFIKKFGDSTVAEFLEGAR